MHWRKKKSVGDHIWTIAETLKNAGDTEISKVWEIGKALWVKDLPKVYEIIRSNQWSDNVSAIVEAIKSRVQERSIELVGSAYTSIKVSDFRQGHKHSFNTLSIICSV